MKLTTTRLKKIIAEETRKVLWEQSAPSAEAIAAEAERIAGERADLVADIQAAVNDEAVQAALDALGGLNEDRAIPTIGAAGAASTASGLGLLDAAFKVSLSAGGDPGPLQDLVVALQNAGVEMGSILMAGGSLTALGIATITVALTSAVIDYVD